MNTKRIVLAILVMVGLGSTMGMAYAQTSDADIGALGYVLAFGSFVASGIFYSASGWIKNIRRKLAGEKVSLDYKKMGQSVAIGVILGLGAFVYSTYVGDTINISTPQQFLTQVGLNTTAILFVDKWILGRADSKTPQTG